MPCRNRKRGEDSDALNLFGRCSCFNVMVLTSKLVLLVAGELLRGLEVVRDELDFPLEEGMRRLHSLHRLEKLGEVRTGEQQAERAVDVFVIEHEGRSVSLAMGLNQGVCRKLAVSLLLKQTLKVETRSLFHWPCCAARSLLRSTTHPTIPSNTAVELLLRTFSM